MQAIEHSRTPYPRAWTYQFANLREVQCIVPDWACADFGLSRQMTC